MNGFKTVELTREAKGKLVMLYVGCRLNGIKKSINDIANEMLLASATSKKLTFCTPHAIYEAHELIDFVCDYIYNEMEQLLYPKNKLNKDFIKSIEGVDREKALFIGVINRIFDFDFLEEINDEDIYIALDKVTRLQLGKCHLRVTRYKFEYSYKFTALIKEAISEYDIY